MSINTEIKRFRKKHPEAYKAMYGRVYQRGYQTGKRTGIALTEKKRRPISLFGFTLPLVSGT